MKRSMWLIGAVLWVAVAGLWSGAARADEAQAGDEPQVSRIEQRADAVLPLWPRELAPLKPDVTQQRVVYREARPGELNRALHDIIQPTLTVYLPEQPDANRPALLVCPGGGYGGVVIDREGYNVADRFSRAGIACFVLKYRLPIGVTPGEDQLPPPIQDVQRALRVIRAGAEQWHIDPDRVGVIGFSAGGHLAGMAATLYNEGDPSMGDPLQAVSARPNFAALIYPVASMHTDITHAGSRNNLIGESASVQVEDRFSIAQRITPDTPPLFVCHAADDPAVKIANSEGIVAAAKEQGVPCQFVRFDIGSHGFSLGNAGKGTNVWPDQFLAWLKDRGVLAGQAEDH